MGQYFSFYGSGLKNFHIRHLSHIKYILCILLVISPLYSQEFVHYTQDNGLPSNKVYMLTIDKQGFIWCATDQGIAMYNGERFTTYTTRNGLPVNDIWRIYVTPDNKLWYFGKSSRLGYIEKGKVYSFPSVTGESMNPKAFFKYKNVMAFDVNECTYYLSGDKWEKVCMDKEIYNYTLKNFQGRSIYRISPLSNFIYVYDGKYFRHYDLKMNLLFSVYHENDYWNSFYNSDLFSQGREKIYILTKTILYIYKPLEKELKMVRLDLKKITTALMEDMGNTIALNTNNGRYVLEGDSLRHVIQPFPFLNNIAFGYFKDDLNNIWVHTFSNGVYKFPNYNNTRHYLPESNIQKVIYYNKTVYAGAEKKGFYKIDRNEAVRIPGVDHYTFYQIREMSPGNIRLVTSHYFFDVKKDHLEAFHYIGDGIKIPGGKDLIEYKDKAYITFTSNVIVVDIKNEHIKRLMFNGAYCLALYKEHIVLGSSSGIKIVTEDTIYNTSYLDNMSVKCLTVYKDRLLIGTDGFGAYMYKDSLSFIKGTEELIVNNIYARDDSTVWLATGFGAHELVFNGKEYSVRRVLNKSTGLRSNHVNDIFVLNDTIYCGTDNGLCLLSLRSLHLSHAPNIMIRSVMMNDSLYNSDHDIVVNTRNNNILKIDFDIAFLNEHQQLRSYYKIVPLDEEWIPISSENITISGLNPGRYTVKILTEGFNNNKDEKTIKITIFPRWYETTWVIALFIMAGLLLLMLFIYQLVTNIVKNRNKKYQIANKLAQTELYALRSKLNPHFIFNSFNSIQYFINNNDTELSEKYLILLSKHIRGVFEYSHLPYISLEKEISLLKDYLEIEKIRFKDKIQIEISTDEKLDVKNSFLPSMLVQPFVENSLNHGLFHKSGTGNLQIRFLYDAPDIFRIQVIDDGTGFTGTESDRVSSTSVINERVNLINHSNEFRIHIEKSFLNEELKNKGTVITITINKLKDVR